MLKSMAHLFMRSEEFYAHVADTLPAYWTWRRDESQFLAPVDDNRDHAPAVELPAQTRSSMSEINFLVEEAHEGGYTARAVGESIFTQAASAGELYARVRDAVRCHCEDNAAPKLIRLHFLRDEVIAA